MSNENIYLMECLPDIGPALSPKADKFRGFVTLYCDLCSDLVYDYDLYDLKAVRFYESPGGTRICHACALAMGLEKAMEFMGCRKTA